MTRRRIRSCRLLATLALVWTGAGIAVPAHGAGSQADDVTPPTIHISMAESPGTGPWAGWYAAPVTIVMSATDDTHVSSLNWRMIGAQPGAAGSAGTDITKDVFVQGITTVTVTARDPARNESSRTFGVGIDLTDPTVTFGGDAYGDIIRRGEVRRLTYTCADQPTAVVSCEARIGEVPFASGEPIPTESNGPRTVTVTATDAVGRRVEETYSYAVLDPRLAVVSPPEIVGAPGTVRVGETLTAIGGRFKPESTTTYRWVQDNEVLAEGPSYVVRPDNVDRLIRVQASGTRPGYEDATIDNEHAVRVLPAAAPVTDQAWTVLKPASLEGNARVGKRLRAVPPRLSGPATSYAYQWLRNGRPIKGATHASYKLRKADARRKVAVRVTAITAHRPDTVSVSTPRKVRR
ncbi:hypothetical protein [Nocardioides sp. L-11A]|uniref:hypothetical protein n=1 Tax=Nocardioides sp. L-11A TaxID=3043848 RepID=UPI00249CD742|nr:hypothetical protein QJ852_22810 [Nocardioides sp. L-11A]